MSFRLRILQVAVLANCACAERTHGLLDAEPLPKECNGVIQLDGRYKTEDAVEYQNDCILRGAPGTEVEVSGKVHFLKNARFEGSLIFRGVRDHKSHERCVDVEGSLEMRADVQLIHCGGENTDDGGGLYVGQDVNISGRLLVEDGRAYAGGGVFAGRFFNVTGGTVQFHHCRGEVGGCLYVKHGGYLQTAGDVSFVDCIAGDFGGGLGVERGYFKQLGGTVSFEDCHARNRGGATAVSSIDHPGRAGELSQLGGSFRAFNCTARSPHATGGAVAVNSMLVSGKMQVDTAAAGGTGGCFSVRRGVHIFETGHLETSNCRATAIDVEGWMNVSGRLDIRNSSSSVSRGGAGVRVAGNMVLGGNATFQNMSTKASGGAIWAKSILQTGGVVCFEHAHARGNGGAIYAASTFVQLNGRMTFNSCSSMTGGALFVRSLWQHGAGMQFYECQAHQQGGAIFALGEVVQRSGTSSLTFELCKADKSGGGIYASLLDIRGHIAFTSCSARRSGGGASVTDALDLEKVHRIKGLEDAPIALSTSSRGQIIINGSLECSRCSAGAGGALFSRADILLTKQARATFRDCSADAFGGALHGRDIDLNGDAVFKNVSALAGGVIQSSGAVNVPDAVMQITSAPQISALKAINISNVSVENSSHVWFVAPEIHLHNVRCDKGLSSFKEEHHVGCKACEENSIQIFGGPVLDENVPVKKCMVAPRGTKEIDASHLTLKKGWMAEEVNISRSFRCPNRLACVGGTISTDGFGPMCAEGYEGQGCVRCQDSYGTSDSNRFVCIHCASSPWRQYMQIARFVVQDLLIFGLSASGIATTSEHKDSKILTNHFMSFVAAAAPVLQAVQETPTFKRILSGLSLDEYVDGASSSMEVGEGSGSTGLSASCVLGYLGFSRPWITWWTRALLNLLTPCVAILLMTWARGWRLATVVGVNCFLPKACLCFARYLVCYRMEPEDEGGELFCTYEMFTGFSLAGLVVVVLAIAISGPALWWSLTVDDTNSGAPFYLYLTASYKEEFKSWEVTRLVRKTCLAIACAALPISLHPAMQIMCISLILLLAFVLEMHYRPYKDDFWNMEEKLLLTTSLAMVSITSCFLANEYHWGSTHRNQRFLLTTILSLIVVPTNILILMILRQLLRESKFFKRPESL